MGQPLTGVGRRATTRLRNRPTEDAVAVRVVTPSLSGHAVPYALDPSPAHDATFWQPLVTQFEASGHSPEVFARRHGVGVHALRSWVYRFRRKLAPAASSPPLRMVPVAPAPPADPARLELTVGPCTLRVPLGTDPVWLAALVTALGRC